MNSSTPPFSTGPVSPEVVSATLDQVDIRSELLSRPCPPPNYEAESRAFEMLAKELSERPRNMLQKLVEMALGLCQADSAGISLLETQGGREVFRWEALAGQLADQRNVTMPRYASPCGICIDSETTQLMAWPDRCFTALRGHRPIVEALLIPFYAHRKAIGTVWLVSHDTRKKFDREDERIVKALAGFASAAWQLWKAAEISEKSNHRKDEFLAVLGHELRNPLAAIRSAAHALPRLETLGDEARQNVEIVVRQVQHLSRMVDDLLDVARLNAGKLKLERQTVELGAVLNDAVEMARGQIERQGHQLTVALPAEPIQLEADPARLAQLVSNLLDNAAKFTPRCGKISLTAERSGSQVRVKVRDTGVGIPGEKVPEIFDLFTQVEQPMPNAGGLGLGLTLVRSLAQMHGGSAECASDGEGKGTEFTIKLPIGESSTPKKPAKKEVNAQPKGCEPSRILLVDDNPDVAESLALELKLDGYSVTIAFDGESALENCQSFQPDVVLVDLGLPGISGYELARRLRQQSRGSDLLIIALSGYGQETHRRESAGAGCDYHLLKPVHMETLLEILEKKRVSKAMPAGIPSKP
jgi:signal transduction histidine kinase/ActR/RegA family two-component response regulator